MPAEESAAQPAAVLNCRVSSGRLWQRQQNRLKQSQHLVRQARGGLRCKGSNTAPALQVSDKGTAVPSFKTKYAMDASFLFVAFSLASGSHLK